MTAPVYVVIHSLQTSIWKWSGNSPVGVSSVFTCGYICHKSKVACSYKLVISKPVCKRCLPCYLQNTQPSPLWSGHTGKTTYRLLGSWNICFGSVLSHIVFHVRIHLFPSWDILVLLLHSPSSVPGLSKWCLSHLEKWRQPASGCHSAGLWKHDLDQRASKLHLQRRWCVFLYSYSQFFFFLILSMIYSHFVESISGCICDRFLCRADGGEPWRWSRGHWAL